MVFTSASPDRVVQEMETQRLQRVWLVGGAELIALFLNLQLIDEFILSIMPLVLGEGIPLFAPSNSEVSLTLVELQQYPSGLVQLKYRQANSDR